MSFGVVTSSRPLLTLPTQAPCVRLSESRNPREWGGVIEPLDKSLWSVRAANLTADSLTGKTHMRMRSLTDRVAQLREEQDWSGLHHIGVADAMVSTVACAQSDLPLLFSFDIAEVETTLATEQGLLATVLTAADAFTVPCPDDLRVVQRVFSPDCPGFVVPPALAPAPKNDAPYEEDLIGCWGVHGRESGLPTLMKLAPSEKHRLLLLGTFEASEMYEFSSILDQHPWSERCRRVGGLSEEECLQRLRLCERALFPARTSRGALFGLRALASGARAVLSRVPLTMDIAGLDCPPEAHWAEKLEAEYEHPPTDCLAEFSDSHVQAAWNRAYQACS